MKEQDTRVRSFQDMCPQGRQRFIIRFKICVPKDDKGSLFVSRYVSPRTTQVHFLFKICVLKDSKGSLFVSRKERDVAPW